MSDALTQFDHWVKDDSNIAALVMRQWFEPVEGRDAVIFPPTYPIQGKITGYNIDDLGNGENVCQIDSVGSQANRMEPIFKRKKYMHLVPQVIINTKVTSNGQNRVVAINLLDAGHRAADAIVLFSTLSPELHEAFRAYKEDYNVEKLARIAPTSIVFGSWDSRATQAKLPRIVRSVIRAFRVQPVHRSAQYSTIAGEILEGPDVEVTVKGPKAELGLAHVPVPMAPGGVLIREDSEIIRDAVLNLVPLRSLRAASGADADNLLLRRYILGLALVAFTAPPETSLREGCQLVPDRSRPAVWQKVKYDGTRSEWNGKHDDTIMAFADEAAKAFGVQQPTQAAEWDGDLARTVMGLSNEQQRKQLLRGGAVTRERLAQITSPKETAGRAKRGRAAGSGTDQL